MGRSRSRNKVPFEEKNKTPPKIQTHEPNSDG